MYSKRFLTNLNKIREAYMTLPYCFKALKEYYSDRVQTLRQILADANDYEPNTRAINLDVFSIVDSTTKQTIACNVTTLSQALKADSDEVKVYVTKIGGVQQSMQIAPSKLVQDLIDNFNDAVTNESFYESLSETAMNVKVKAENFITNIQSKLGTIQLPEKASTFLAVLKNSNNPVEAFQAVMTSPAPTVDLVFDFDDFNTSTSPFLSAIIELASDITNVLKGAFAGVNSLKKAIQAGIQAVVDLTMWVLKKVAGNLFVDYTFSENGTAGCDVPIFSMVYNSEQDFINQFGSPQSYYSCYNNVFGTVYWDTFLGSSETNVPLLVNKLHETGFIEIAIPRGIIRLFLNNDNGTSKVYLYLYATAYDLTPDWSAFRTSKKYNELNQEENSSFADLLIDNMTYCAGYLFSLPGLSSNSSFKNKVFNTSNPAGVITNFKSVFYDITAFNTTDHAGSANFVDSLWFKNVVYGNTSFDKYDMACDIARCMVMHLLFAITYRNYDEDYFTQNMTIINTGDPTTTVDYIGTQDNSWKYGYYPYYTYDSSQFDVHAQTDSERIKEVKMAIVALVVAVAAVVITVKVVKLRKKILKKALERDVAAWEAWDTAAKESDPDLKNNLMQQAWKVQKQSNRWNKLASLFGFNTISDVADTYTKSYYSDKSDASTEQILHLIR